MIKQAIHRNKGADDIICPDWTRETEAVLYAAPERLVVRTAEGALILNAAKEEQQRIALDWQDITQASFAPDHYVLLRNDGTAFAVGDDLYGQCQVADRTEWAGITQAAVGPGFIAGLKPDGTVLSYGHGRYHATEVHEWKNIVDIRYVPWDDGGILGKTADGKQLFSQSWRYEDLSVQEGQETGDAGISYPPREVFYPDGGLRERWRHQIDWVCGSIDTRWLELREVIAAENCTFAIRSDGTVAAAGQRLGNTLKELSGWRNIVRLSPTMFHGLILGIDKDGMLRLACGGMTGRSLPEGWGKALLSRPLISVSAGSWDDAGNSLFLVGLDREGTPVASGVKGGPFEGVNGWRDIRALSLANVSDICTLCVAGLRADGRAELALDESVKSAEAHRRAVLRWCDLTQLCCSHDDQSYGLGLFIAGLRADGSVVLSNGLADHPAQNYAENWREIQQIWLGAGYLIGQRRDGRFLAIKVSGQ